MQRKLRLRFILISWALLLLLLAALCSGISLYLYQAEIGETERALQKAIESQTLTDETRGMAALEIDENGKIRKYEQSHLGLTGETMEAIAKEIGIRDVQKIKELEVCGRRYRSLAIPRRGGVYAVVAECTQEESMAKRLRRNTIFFTLLGMVLLTPVSILLAMWVSKPIKTAFDKQNDFVSDATHELKTPLTVIAANTEAVLSNPDAPIETQEKFLDSIKDETQRMSGLVGDLLFLAKIDAGEIHLDREDLNISDLIEGLCMERETDIFEAGRDFDYDMTPEMKYNGDWKRIRQMIEALLDNAQMYTPVGGKIRVVANHDRKQQLRIVISNSGEPISEEDLTKIFDRFYRADPSRARETGGYGLGLCVAKSIAELHNGTITAESANGINVFTVILGNGETEGQAKNK